MEKAQDIIRALGETRFAGQLRHQFELLAFTGATVAALVNTAPRLLNAPAGLRLMTDLPVPRIA